MGKVCTGKFIGENSMANLGFRNPWPEYRKEKGDVVAEPHKLGGHPSKKAERVKARLEVAQAVAASNKAAKVKDRGGKPLYLVELDSLFSKLEKVQAGAKDALLRHRAKTALVDLARLRSKLSGLATAGTKPVVDFRCKSVSKFSVEKPTQEAMAAITRREVSLFRARWASLLS